MVNRFHRRKPSWVSLVVVSAVCLATAFAEPSDKSPYRVFFSRSFPGSVPEYFEVVVESSGKSSYRETQDEDPLEFEVSGAELTELLEYVKKLDYFRATVESNRKVAFTGKKTLRFEGADGEKHQIQFNYTQNRDARALLDWFQKVGETERHRMELEKTARFDRLGVNKTLLFFQISFDKKRVVAPGQFVPILKKIANDNKIIHIARARAASLLERIEGKASTSGP